MRRRWCLVVGGLVAASLVAVPPTAAGAADKKAYCANNLKLNLAINKLLSSSSGQPSAAAVSQAEGKILKLLDDAVKTAPADILDEVKIESTNGHAELLGALNDPAVQQASLAVAQWARTNCGFKAFNVTGVEYAFRGIPTAIKTGTVLFNFKDAGAQSHQLYFARIKTKDSPKVLLGLPIAEAAKRIEIVGGTGINPGQSAALYVQFTTPGRYAAFDLIPDGTTATQTGTGPRHADLGMYTEFKVT